MDYPQDSFYQLSKQSRECVVYCFRNAKNFRSDDLSSVKDYSVLQMHMVHPMPAEQVGLDNMMKYYQTKKHHQLCRLACGFLGLERIHAIQIRYCVVRWFSPCISKATL